MNRMEEILKLAAESAISQNVVIYTFHEGIRSLINKEMNAVLRENKSPEVEKAFQSLNEKLFGGRYETDGSAKNTGFQVISGTGRNEPGSGEPGEGSAGARVTGACA